MSLDAKSFDLDVFGSPNVQIEDLKILEYVPRMLKALNSKFLYPKILNSKPLRSWVMPLHA